MPTLYKLFAPARYTRYSLRFVMIMAAGIALIVILDAVFDGQSSNSTFNSATVLSLGANSLLGTVLV